MNYLIECYQYSSVIQNNSASYRLIKLGVNLLSIYNLIEIKKRIFHQFDLILDIKVDESINIS